MRKWSILLLALMLVFPSPADAQSVITLDSLKVRLWAEYDQPSMLVLYDFQVTDDTLLPANVDIRVPKDGNIIAIAYDDAGSLLNAEFTGPVEDGDWQVITFRVTEYTTYHLEYYQALTREGDLRKFTYQWSGKHPVNDFSLEIDVPADSTGVKTTPAIPFVQGQPFLSGGAMKSGLEVGEAYQVKLEYSRTSDTTVESPPSSGVEPSTPVDTTAEGRVTLDNLPYILGGFGVILILGAAYYYWRANMSQPSAKPRRRRAAQPESDSQTYCHECGARAQPGDRFCRTCGNKLRA
ncbi:MAG: hypothetical protein C3F07_07540 [Anaerolineales bacterium]|nr:zinc ribbon domain-containing protein [Anaerolineae bacterium]PWB74434.1 MAG: hypothetical protein C3F07_07540 [Anaerolineales bacterium]